jgi:hypothetical protein
MYICISYCTDYCKRIFHPLTRQSIISISLSIYHSFIFGTRKIPIRESATDGGLKYKTRRRVITAMDTMLYTTVASITNIKSNHISQRDG